MQETQKQTPKRWMMILAFVLAAGLLYLALRKVDWNELAVTLSQGNLTLLALAACILSLSCFVRALRWRVLLSAAPQTSQKPPILTVFWATMAGYLGNAYLPARAGELVRSVLVGQECGISKSFALATALTERIVDAVILVAVCSIALAALPVLPAELVGAVQAMAVVGVVGAATVFIAPRMSGLVQRLIASLPLSAGLRTKLSDVVSHFLTGAGALQHWGRLAQFFLYSIVLWSLDTFNGLVIASAFGLSLSMIQVFVLLAALGIASALPSTPGYVGVYQFIAVTVLTPFGFSQAQSLAYILAFQGVQYIVITFWGLIGLWRLRGAIRF